MFKGLHPYLSKTYLFDSSTNIHVTNSSVQAKIITYDFLHANKKLKENYLKFIKKKKKVNIVSAKNKS